jgi:2-dehydro-3-deoxy-D-arabinonate dehydratase
MKLYRTKQDILLQLDDRFYFLKEDWDELINRENLFSVLTNSSKVSEAAVSEEKIRLQLEEKLLAPASRQEVWAAGVTYQRSKEARMEESNVSGGADFYDKVYEAERPELFFKSLPHRLSGHGQEVYIRKDSSWNVPEPELTLFINSSGRIVAYTIGNDMSSRSIEGENPLYLPQAKVYEKSAALGPCLYVPEKTIDPDTLINMVIRRDGEIVFNESASINRMKRSHTELASYLYRECDFPYGAFLMTGTCIVPPTGFTLKEKDQVDIRIDPIGTLSNRVGYKPLKK